MVSRFGDAEDHWYESATLLATLLMTLRGTPTIYQGDEIGMTNSPFKELGDYRDVDLMNAYQEAMDTGMPEAEFLRIAAFMGRDHARTPVQWDASPNGGFTSASPWIGVNPNFDQINIDAQRNEPSSILSFYKKLIHYRKTHNTLVYGEVIDLSEDHAICTVFQRKDEQGDFRVLLNFSNQVQAIKEEWIWGAQMEISNYSTGNPAEQLQPWEARIYKQ